MNPHRPNSSPKQTDLLSAIMESAVDSIIVIDRSGIIQKVNPATERMFGFCSDEIVGHNVKVLMPPNYREEHDGYLDRYQRTGQARIIGTGREVVGRRKDGSDFPMHLAVSEFSLDGETHYAGIVRDISDLKDVQNQLVQLNDALEVRILERTEELRRAQAELVAKEKLATLGQVSGGIAHEIRNPLNAVKTSAYFLMNAKSVSPDKMREHLERIDRQVGLIDNVVTSLTDVARLPEPKLIRCSLAEVFASVLGDVSGLENITIVNDLTNQDAIVFADKNQLQIVFRNLIRNARDAIAEKAQNLKSEKPNGADRSPDPNRITISVQADGKSIALSISDTGVGISPEQLDRILEPFFTTKARGMGLGLAITRTIVEKNDADISVNSKLGEGTTFTIRFPAAKLNLSEENSVS
ncbi:Sensor protein FixL [Rubripirellula obstinata]|uniref:Sensor protein FixL n=1 Tax=Rubripirellula obstinata TaxID=406547 RepID=A0A5B1CJ17_9BACT|nr:PAS domain S-box protein [Rubripirellula obstinata]KAA1259274.1 Sensor protein FixL [Rubripirellula obstinata]